MNEEKRITIKFQGKEVKEKQLLIRSKKQGTIEYNIFSKKISIVLHTNGVKNIILEFPYFYPQPLFFTILLINNFKKMPKI